MNSLRPKRRLLIACLSVLGGCHSSKQQAPDPAKNSSSPTTPSGAEILLIGTSLTAGYGLDPSQSWAAHLQQKIDSAGLAFHVQNAGVSGETSADALHRIDWLLAASHPALIMLETGANDALRGQSLDSIAANVDAILARLDRLAPHPVIVVAGMEALPNLGRVYRDRFRAIFPAAAQRHHAVYLPFLLDHVAGIDSLNQADGIHPNSRGSLIVADNVWRVLHPLLDSLQQGSR